VDKPAEYGLILDTRGTRTLICLLSRFLAGVIHKRGQVFPVNQRFAVLLYPDAAIYFLRQSLAGVILKIVLENPVFRRRRV